MQNNLDKIIESITGKRYDNPLVKSLLKDVEYRITQENGEHFCVTMDFNTERLNLRIEEDVIFDVSIG